MGFHPDKPIIHGKHCKQKCIVASQITDPEMRGMVYITALFILTPDGEVDWELWLGHCPAS